MWNRVSIPTPDTQGETQVSRRETLESQTTTLVSVRFAPPARATGPSSRNRFPHRASSCTGPVPELICVAGLGTRAGAATAPLADCSRTARSCTRWCNGCPCQGSVQAAGRPCRPARLDDPTSVLPSWRSTSAASVRTCCFTSLQQRHGLTPCTLSSPPLPPPPRTSENGTSEAGTWNLRRPKATSKNGTFIAGAAPMRWNWDWNRSACCRSPMEGGAGHEEVIAPIWRQR